MSLSSGHWYAALSSRELGQRPVGRVRFGERLVFWRDAQGAATCLRDQCAHRGAALSLGRVRNGRIECPFHGFCYDRSGQCTRVPVEEQQDLAAALKVPALPATEAGGYVWVWRGPPTDALPLPPRLAPLDGLAFGESRYTWHAHYTRCIENVLDYSHLPYVHRTTLGARIRDPVCPVTVETIAGGLRARRARDAGDRQYIELHQPNVWINRVGQGFLLSAAFMPVDDQRTDACVRWHYPAGWRLLRPLVDALGALSQHLVFRDDWPIVESQRPGNVDQPDCDRLVPSDAAIIAFRRQRRALQAEAQGFAAAAARTTTR